MPLDLIENAGKIERTAPDGKKYWQYLGKYKCSFCSAIVFRRRPNENNSCGCQQNNRAVYRATGPTSHVRHNRSEAVLHCKHYQDCLNRIREGFKMDSDHATSLNTSTIVFVMKSGTCPMEGIHFRSMGAGQK